MKKKFEKILLEKGINFDYIKLQKTIGDIKKLDKQFKKQLEKLGK